MTLFYKSYFKIKKIFAKITEFQLVFKNLKNKGNLNRTKWKKLNF